MFQLFKKYKGVIRFIGIFLGTYLVLALLYDQYLEHLSSERYYPDPVTHLVALQSQAVISAMGYESLVLPSSANASMNLFVNDYFSARIIEGCNAISIIVLFIAFMLAFFGRLKSSLIYMLAGAVIIYVMNIIRIVILSIGLYEVPQYGHFLHRIVFPLIIYGTVFILWVIWIRIYSRQKQTES